MLNTISRLFF